MKQSCICAMLMAALYAVPKLAVAGEGPYFVTYTHQLEEQGNLEFETRSMTARPSGGDKFAASALEFEYGVLGWWTTELYLDGQTTRNDSTLYTGSRWESRFRLTKQEHWINPVLYLEFENTNGADKTLLEVVGHDRQTDLTAPNSRARLEKQREMEGKLLLGSNWHGWNFSENFIVEKNIAHAPYEFGYAVGVSHPLALRAKPYRCNWCGENFNLGLEAYGGLGDTWALNLKDTSQYLAPSLEWTLANGIDLKVSPSFGLTSSSIPFFVRFGISYEIAQFARRFHK